MGVLLTKINRRCRRSKRYRIVIGKMIVILYSLYFGLVVLVLCTFSVLF